VKGQPVCIYVSSTCWCFTTAPHPAAHLLLQLLDQHSSARQRSYVHLDSEQHYPCNTDVAKNQLTTKRTADARRCRCLAQQHMHTQTSPLQPPKPPPLPPPPRPPPEVL